MINGVTISHGEYIPTGRTHQEGSDMVGGYPRVGEYCRKSRWDLNCYIRSPQCVHQKYTVDDLSRNLHHNLARPAIK